MEKFEQKEEVPQINDYSGLSDDYVSEHAGFPLTYDVATNRNALDWLVEDLASTGKDSFATRGYLVRKYAEKFNPATYRDVINEKNKASVEKLDAEVDKIQLFFAQHVRPLLPACKKGSLTPEEKSIVRELASLLVSFSKTTTRVIQGTEKRAHQS